MNRNLPLSILTFSFAFISMFSWNAGVAQTSNQPDSKYTQVITQRSNKIVAVLGITDSAKFYRVQNILVQQYSSLNSLHEPLNENIKSIKKDSTIDKKAAAEKVAGIENDRASKTAELHKKFIAALSAELQDEQIVKVKDGMTYNVLNVTYKGYTDMIPSLKEDEKKQIYAWLVEARELAMDAESSDKKHWWFGKYKGRINNYLAKAGYDITKEREEWNKRIKAAKDKEAK